MNFTQIAIEAEMDYGIRFFENGYRDGKPIGYDVGRTPEERKATMLKSSRGRMWRGSAKDENGRRVVVRGTAAYVADWCVSAAIGEVREDLWPGRLEVVLSGLRK